MPYDVHAHLACLSKEETYAAFSSSSSPSFLIASAHSFGDYEASLEALKGRPESGVSAGVHPMAADADSPECISFLEALPDILKGCVALGEAGYDIHPSNRPMEEQRFFFRKQLEYAKRLSLPVIIHCRNAFEAVFEDIRELKPDLPLILHGYSGGFKYLNDALRLGCHISFGLPLSWPESSKLRRIAAMLPAERILTESDSPFCFSYRGGGRSLPNMVASVEAAVAEARGISADEADELIAGNVRRIFGIH